MTNSDSTNANRHSDTDKQSEGSRQLEAIGRKRLQKLIPAKTKAVIVAELHKDESEKKAGWIFSKSKELQVRSLLTH